MTVIYMDNWNIETAKSYFLAFSGENLTEELIIVPDSIEDYTYTIDCQNGDSKGIISLEPSTYGNKPALYVLLKAGQIGPSGNAKMQVIGRRTGDGDTLVKKSNVFRVTIGKSVNAIDNFPDTPISLVEQYMTQAKESAESAGASAEAALNYANSSLDSANNASDSEKNSKESETNAAQSEIVAKASADNAKKSENKAVSSAESAESHDSHITEIYNSIMDYGLSITDGKLCITYSEVNNG